MREQFDVGAFFSALDATRIARGLNWRAVAQQCGISASTLTRLGQGKRPDVDSLAALLTWSGLSVDDFIQRERVVHPEPLAMISTYLRADKNLTPEAADALDEMIRAAYERLRRRSEGE